MSRNAIAVMFVIPQNRLNILDQFDILQLVTFDDLEFLASDTSMGLKNIMVVRNCLVYLLELFLHALLNIWLPLL